jgi:hypothetical protein
LAKDEKTAGASFAAYVLLSEAIQFTTDEIAEAVLEDYPGLDIDTGSGLQIPQACDTAEFITAPMFFGAGGEDGGNIVSLIRLPGYGTWDPERIGKHQMLGAFDIDLKAALGQNRSYVCVSVSARGDSLKDRFRAARLCSCIAATFAKLPVALAVYWETGDQFLSPKRVVAMADTAMANDWPVQDWIGLVPSPRGRDEAGRDWSAGVTGGLSPFTGYELELAAAPISVADACSTLWSTAWLPLVSGNEFRDGHTAGPEDAPSDQKYVMRFLPKGASAPKYGPDALPTDRFVLIHRESPFDVEAYFGPAAPAVAEKKTVVVTQSPRPGFFKRVMGGGRGT